VHFPSKNFEFKQRS